MSLSACIAVGPSRRIALLSAVLAVGGIGAAAATGLARWPAMAAPLGVGVTVAASLVVVFLVAHHRRTPRRVLTVSDRAEIVVARADGGDEATMRLVESAMTWPGFSVLAMKDDVAGRRGVLHLPVLEAELSAIDRRALSRFLLWSLRGGAGAMASQDFVGR